MDISKYCKNNGMNYTEYKKFKSEIEEKALAAIEKSKQLYSVDTGVYHESKEIIEGGFDKCFIIDEMKKHGVEFINNCELYRI